MRLRALTLTSRALRESSRSKHPYLLRAGLCALLLLAAYSAQVTGRMTNLSGVVLVQWVFWVNFAMISFLGVSIFSSAITEEREQMTLGLLRMAGFSPLSIILGKSLALFLQSALLLSVQLPFTVLAVTLGGISIASVAQGFSVLFGYLVFVYGIGIFASVLSSRVGRAARLATSLLLIYHLLPPFLVWAFGGIFGGVFLLPLEYSAYGALVGTLSVVVGGTQSVVGVVLFNISVGAALLLVSWWVFSRYQTEDGPRIVGSERKVTQSARGENRSWMNAIAWKEFYFASGGSRRFFVRLLLYVAFVILCFATMNIPTRAEAVGGVCLVVGLSLAYLDAGIAAGRMFQREIRDQTLGTLFSMPVSVADLAWNKLLGALPVLGPGLIVAGFGGLLNLEEVFEGAGEVSKYPIAWYGLFCVPFSLILTVAFSLRLPRAAFVASLASMFMVNVFLATVLRVVFGGDADSMGAIGLVGVVLFGVLLVQWIGTRLEALAAEE